jgi:hypothetical protein
MTDNIDLESRVERLEAGLREQQDYFKLQQLRHRYWLSLMDKNVAALVDCFCEDARLDYGFDILLQGKSQIAPFFEQLLGNDDLIRQTPRGADPLLNVTGENSAEGRWLVEVIALRKSEEQGTRIGVQYYEDYCRVDGQWKIAAMKNEYLYFESMTLKDAP